SDFKSYIFRAPGMASMDVATGTIFLSQTVFGTLGNFSLLYHYLFLYPTEHRLRPTDLILKHLMIANSLALLSKGVPQTMTAFGFKDFLNEAGCKLVFYLHRIGRDAVTWVLATVQDRVFYVM
uniref:Vomeronasal type-1 receptor n=1 Tax=Lynx canadensis TaxID=61383 RepID=A0A667IK42_LYNCA